jgi:hypothetical protein
MQDTHYLKSHIISALDLLLAKIQTPTMFENKSEIHSLQNELHELSQNEQRHLEQEFADYEQR